MDYKAKKKPKKKPTPKNPKETQPIQFKSS